MVTEILRQSGRDSLNLACSRTTPSRTAVTAPQNHLMQRERQNETDVREEETARDNNSCCIGIEPGECNCCKKIITPNRYQICGKKQQISRQVLRKLATKFPQL